MKNEKVVIFDFDGTIADIEDLIKKLYGEVAEDRGWPPLTDEAYRELRTGSIAQAIKWVGVRPWQVPGLMREGRNRLYALRDQIELFSGISELIESLYKKDWHIYVLSANSTKTIHAVLERNNIDNLATVLKRPALFGKSRSVSNLIWRKGYLKEQVWMVGDEVRDIEAANKSGVRSIAVTWGLQDVGILKANSPTAIAESAKDIERILDEQ